ncbi:hypothetical protein [Saccharomonospora piscinae]|uniref:hypothetical protein n=1 Tax=Saccharomonospora piscinae TaxID=687388 RepID=UPI00159493F7|nr:hypothetical protein [Saccharomonospora piscinae]
MLHVHPADDNADIEALADAVGVLRKVAPQYAGPINTCPLCGTPTSGVLCTPCATK